MPPIINTGHDMKRRALLKASAASGLLHWSSSLWAQSLAKELRHLGEPTPFDFAYLKGRARTMAERPYQAPDRTVPTEIKALNWDQFQAIRYRDDHALWKAEGLPFQIKFFHLGLYFDSPVRIYELQDGNAQELAYDPELFDYGKSGLHGEHLPKTLGFAGFRVNFHSDLTRDVTAFLGASYFRAVGGEWQYGISARGLAIDCGQATPEEFPRFIAFWLQRPTANTDTLTVYALLDSPSVSGAYRFDIRPGSSLTMDIDAALYSRRTLEHIGLAPLTSMFRCGENECQGRDDWRPEIHDSDGLFMWRGNGEQIWRPLGNPSQLRFNDFQDNNPRGFGLLQRDRNFDHYQDDGVFYERRPSVWVEPKGGWGEGSVQLVELPTDDETSDNIVAFWHPQAPLEPGKELLFSYRLYWGATTPVDAPLAQVVATRTGLGGIVGQKRTYFSWRFVVDFAGRTLSALDKGAQPVPIISASRGRVELVSARPLESIRGYRAMFDLVPAEADSLPVNLRLYLALDGHALSETWLYQWTPPTHRGF